MTPRIYVGADGAALAPGAEYRLPPPASRHVAQVLRLRTGDAIVLFTGQGGEYVAQLVRLGRREVVARVEGHAAVERESTFPVTLAQSLIAADMMDFTVRKAVELGVAAVVPLASARSQGLPRERVLRRVAHWRQIAVAACEQCGRNRLPEIADVAPFDDWIAATALDDAAILDAAAARSLAAQARARPPQIVAVGPEGGFTEEELRRARARGAVPVHLGTRTLRAETAAIAALATIGAIAGDAR